MKTKIIKKMCRAKNNELFFSLAYIACYCIRLLTAISGETLETIQLSLLYFKIGLQN